jgi:NAD+--asparagine ADP-ribosyltransferase
MNMDGVLLPVMNIAKWSGLSLCSSLRVQHITQQATTSGSQACYQQDTTLTCWCASPTGRIYNNERHTDRSREQIIQNGSPHEEAVKAEKMTICLSVHDLLAKHVRDWFQNTK